MSIDVGSLTAIDVHVHAERNDAFVSDPMRRPEPVHFVQMWVRPDVSGLTPSYRQREVAVDDLGRDWLPIASGGHGDAVVDVASAGSTLWATVLAAGVTRTLPTAALTHVYLAGGSVEVETDLTGRDRIVTARKPT